MSKNQLEEASRICIFSKYSEKVNIEEYSFDETTNTLVVSITDPMGKLIGYLTTWEESGLIKHHLY